MSCDEVEEEKEDKNSTILNEASTFFYFSYGLKNQA